MGDALRQLNGEQAAGEQAHGHEARMAQRQLTQQAHHQIQGHRHDDVAGHGDEHIGDLPAGSSGVNEGSGAAAEQGGDEQRHGVAAEAPCAGGHILSHSLHLLTDTLAQQAGGLHH